MVTAAHLPYIGFSSNQAQELCSTTWHNGTKIPQLTSIKQLKEVLRNYDGMFLKVDGAYVVDVNLDEMWFHTRKERQHVLALLQLGDGVLKKYNCDPIHPYYGLSSHQGHDH